MTKQLFFSDSGKRSLLTRSRWGCRWSIASSIWKKKKECTEPSAGLTTALGSIIKTLVYDLLMFARAQKAKCRAARAVKDAKLMEDRVGSDIWREMAWIPMQGLVYIHEHKDDPGFCTKLAHQSSNQFLSVIIFPNCYPGRCGGWERISREEMVQ